MTAPIIHSSSRLTAEDLIELAAAPPGALPSSRAPLLKALRDSHHRLARLVADGLSDVEAAAISGYTPQRIRQLKEDPAFVELLAFYREKKDSAYVDMHERLKEVGLDALAVLHERLRDDPEKVSNDELLKTLSTTLDRAGFGPTTKVDHRHVHYTPEALGAIKNAAQAAPLVVAASRRLPPPGGSGATEDSSAPDGAEAPSKGTDANPEGGPSV